MAYSPRRYWFTYSGIASFLSTIVIVQLTFYCLYLHLRQLKKHLISHHICLKKTTLGNYVDLLDTGIYVVLSKNCADLSEIKLTST